MVLLLPAVAALLTAAMLSERRRRRAAERLGAATMETLLNAIDANDAETGAHVRRVAAIALAMGDAMGLDEQESRNVERVALFHDVGKIHEALFDILHDSARLSDDERRAVATHPARGYEVLAPLEAFYPDLRDGVLSHHERWDGTGYPRGLARDQIPLAARIVAIADAYDAITAARRYSDARSASAAVEVIRAGRATQFDPKLVDLFLLPPVLLQVDSARSRALQATPDKSRRRRHSASTTPDVRFRWRSGLLARRRRGARPRR
jgi:HD-GYP domain-containing protein (c-di-GMP phosphodiesterase class II)